MTTPMWDAAIAGLIGPVEPFQPGARLTNYASWFTTPDQRTLILAVAPDVAPNNAAVAVAHALAWQQDRELLLVVPAAAVDPVAARLAYVSTPVRLWSVGDDLRLTEVPIPTVDDVVAAAGTRRLRSEAEHGLGEYEAWVADLIEGANRHWALDTAHRGSYLAWHCDGRQVLTLSRSGARVQIRAGVQYRNPPSNREPLAHAISAPLTRGERAAIEAAIAVAVNDRIGGLDNTHVEHQMQAALGRTGLPELGLVEAKREYPAWRADDAPGYIDFLGLDDAGQLHVVETKIGPDEMLVFQALDYLSWVRANAPAIRSDLGWPAGDDSVVHIDFVVAPKLGNLQQPAIGPYTPGQLAALRDDVPWRIHLVDDPRSSNPVLTSLPPRQLPAPEPGVVAPPVG